MKPLIFLRIPAALALSANSAAAAAQTLHGPSDSYVLQYPSTLKLHMASGQGCSNGVCRPIEQASLDGPDGSMTLVVQRNINPKHLPIREWYASLARRPLEAPTETSFSLGGRDAIRRHGLVPGATVRSLNGKVVSRKSTLLSDDSIFVPLNGSDILTIVVHPKTASAAAMLERLTQSIRFGESAP